MPRKPSGKKRVKREAVLPTSPPKPRISPDNLEEINVRLARLEGIADMQKKLLAGIMNDIGHITKMIIMVDMPAKERLNAISLAKKYAKEGL